MNSAPPKPQRTPPSWTRTLLRVLLICAGSVAILLPAWLPDRPTVPIGRGTVELLQAFFLAAAAAVMLGAAPHAGTYRPVCRVLAMGLIAAFVGEIEDFVSGILQWPFPEVCGTTGTIARCSFAMATRWHKLARVKRVSWTRNWKLQVGKG